MSKYSKRFERGGMSAMEVGGVRSEPTTPEDYPTPASMEEEGSILSSSSTREIRDLSSRRHATEEGTLRKSRDGGDAVGTISVDQTEEIAGEPADVAFMMDDEDDAEEAADERRMPRASDGGQRWYSCDACAGGGGGGLVSVFPSLDALHQHALDQHGDHLRDYQTLKALTNKLQPVWMEVRQTKRELLHRWGRRVWLTAISRDAGEAKMAEAQRARAQLEVVVRRWHPTAEVYIFGSSIAFGVWDGMSDIDFTVVDREMLDAGTWPPSERNAVRSITELLRRAGFSFLNLEPISHARVPIVKHHASSPIRVHPATTGTSSGVSPHTGHSSLLEAEDVISRSVRVNLTSPATRQDRIVLEGSIRTATGIDGIQQVWWNRTGEVLCLTCSSTTKAMVAATCPLAFVTPSLRARVQPLHDECRPELHNIDFDMSFRVFGVRNSQLLRRYLLSHPCARPGALVLKDWSKTSGVNNSLGGYLTSYAINIMWIYYLVQEGLIAYVDPTEDIPATLADSTTVEQREAFYVPMLEEGLQEAQLDAQCQKMGELLVGFFYFYAVQFDWENHVVSLNRRGVTTKKSLGWDREDIPVPAADEHAASQMGGRTLRVTNHHPTRYMFCIEDPYEENLNLGRHMGVTKSLRVHAELCRGLLSLLKDDDAHSCVFAAAADPSTLAHASNTSTLLEYLRGRARCPGGQVDAPRALGGTEGAANLPLKVLYKLMAISMKEVSLAASAATAVSGADSSEGVMSVSGGVPEAALEAAFKRDAALEYDLARKAWNWQQLLHRLGLKLHRGHVFARREVGLRRVAAHPQTIRTSPTDGEASSSRSLGDATNVSETMLQSLMSGFLRLTPEWVAWSTPWAALHSRGNSTFTPTAVEPHRPPTEQVQPNLDGLLRATSPRAAPWRLRHNVRSLQRMARTLLRRK